MHIYKSRHFEKWAAKEGLADSALVMAVVEMEAGLIDAHLGGCVVKKRLALPGRGKRSGSRTLLAYLQGERAVFIYGFAKNERGNIDGTELRVLKRLAAIYLGFDAEQIAHALAAGNLFEVTNHD